MKSALIVSPFSTVPADAGQRRRAAQSTQVLRQLGYRITFLLYAFEDGWKTRYNEAWAEELRQQWDEVIIFRANPKVGIPPENWSHHSIDEWWDSNFSVVLDQIGRYRTFDVVVVHNVWLSKAFDSLPSAAVKILESHDVFCTRSKSFAQLGVSPEFFFPNEWEEIFGANRADIVLSIHDQDNVWFSERIRGQGVSLPYSSIDPVNESLSDNIHYHHPDKVVFGFVGSGHIFNIHGLKAFLQILKERVGETDAPVEIRIGGRVCTSIEGRGPFVLCGYVEDEADFFADVDFVIAPVFYGSGFKIKTADALAMGKPLLMSRHSAIGLRAPDRMVFDTPEEMVEACIDIALDRPSLEPYRLDSRLTQMDLQVRAEVGVQYLDEAIRRLRTCIVFDLRGLTEREAATVLQNWSGAFHLFWQQAHQLVLADGDWVGRVLETAPPGVRSATAAEAAERAGQVRFWVTTGRAPLEPLRVRPEGVVVDVTWGTALGFALDPSAAALVTDARAAQKTPNGPIPADSGTAVFFENFLYWHNLNWDEVIPCLRQKMEPASTKASQKVLSGIYLISGDYRQRLQGPFRGLFDTDVRIVSPDDPEAVIDALWMISTKKVQWIVSDEAYPSAATQLLITACLARGIPFQGAMPDGLWSDPVQAGGNTQKMYQRYEKQWVDLLKRFVKEAVRENVR